MVENVCVPFCLNMLLPLFLLLLELGSTNTRRCMSAVDLYHRGLFPAKNHLGYYPVPYATNNTKI